MSPTSPSETPAPQLSYGNRSFTIPATGVIELVAQKSAETYRIGSRSFNLAEKAQTNEFGAATVEFNMSS